MRPATHRWATTGIGVEVLDAPLVQIGVGGQGNLISGNGGRGVRISGGNSAGALVRGNFIGTDSTGSFDVGNASDGIEVVDVERRRRSAAPAPAKRI